MIFSELYSAYYTAVAHILTEALQGDMTENRMRVLAEKYAFSESAMTIVPALKTGKWQLMDDALQPVLEHVPTMPLTTLQKRWLKSLCDDPRIKLFGVSLPELEGVQPLFTRADYRVYDQYGDGDPYEDLGYIRNFRVLLEAIKTHRPVEITLLNRFGRVQWLRFRPEGLEYSLKDDKMRVLANGCHYRYFNLAKIASCKFYEGHGRWDQQPKEDAERELSLMITDERNALERVMLHFAHFEKQAERLTDGRYLLKMKYRESDETEILIRVLSFGPKVQVVAPQSFVELVKTRLQRQKSCELL